MGRNRRSFLFFRGEWLILKLFNKLFLMIAIDFILWRPNCPSTTPLFAPAQCAHPLVPSCSSPLYQTSTSRSKFEQITKDLSIASSLVPLGINQIKRKARPRHKSRFEPKKENGWKNICSFKWFEESLKMLCFRMQIRINLSWFIFRAIFSISRRREVII